MGYFLGLILVIGHFGLSHLASSISTLNFGPPSMNLVGPTRTTDLVPVRLRRNSHFYVWPKSVFLVKNPFFPTKKHLKFAERLIFIWEKGTFLFAQFFPLMARTWWEPRSGRFLPYHPKFCQRPVCSPWRDGSFRTLGSIFLLFFSEFPGKKTGRRAKKSSLVPLWGHRLPITAHDNHSIPSHPNHPVKPLNEFGKQWWVRARD